MDAPLCKSCGTRHWERVCRIPYQGATKPLAVQPTYTETIAANVMPPYNAPASSSGRTLTDGSNTISSKRGSNPRAGAKKATVRQQPKKARSSAVEPSAHNASVAGSIPAAPTKVKVGFDRNAYQRDYMADKRKADKLGITVREYRAQRKATEVKP